MDAANLKTINYRGGVVRFRIPADWQEEYEPAGGGTFYAPGDDTGTFPIEQDEFQREMELLEREARRCSRDLSRGGEGVVSRLDYASRRTSQAGRGVGYWFLIVLNSITLVIGFIAAGMLYSTTVDRQGLGQVGAFAVAGPMALLEIPIAVVSCRLARRWRDPLAIVSTVSALVNAGAGVALVFVPLGH